MRAFLVLLAGIAAMTAQPSFDRWKAMGEGGTVGVDGKSGLAFTYSLGVKRFAAAVLPVSGELAQMQRIRLRVKADRDTAVAILLSEHKPGGGDYSAWFWAPANQWQQIELGPGDFSANDGPKDAVDADGKLDLDQVEGVGIFDLAHFFGALPESPGFPVIVAKSTGTHTLLLDDFEILNSAAPRAKTSPASIPIDSFDRGFLQWITFGGIDLKLSTADNPLGRPALQASYEQIEG